MALIHEQQVHSSTNQTHENCLPSIGYLIFCLRLPFPLCNCILNASYLHFSLGESSKDSSVHSSTVPGKVDF